jgi:hypothetical protein
VKPVDLVWNSKEYFESRSKKALLLPMRKTHLAERCYLGVLQCLQQVDTRHRLGFLIKSVQAQIYDVRLTSFDRF